MAGLPEKLLYRQSLQRSAREWLNVYREVMRENRKHGLSRDGEPKSRFSPVDAPTSVDGSPSLDVNYDIEKTSDGYAIIFNLPGYILALDRGVRGGRFQYGKPRSGGKSAFITSLQDWIKTRHIQTELSTLSLAIAIRNSILQEGTAPTNILNEIESRYAEKFAQEIADGYFQEMENFLVDNIQRLEENFK